MANDCTLLVDGLRYGGWQDISIQRGLEQVAGQFSLQVTERWPGQEQPRPLQPGQAATLLIDGEAVLTGWLEEVQPGFEASRCWLNVGGRDRTADLIDCSAVFRSGQWKGSSLQRIAEDLLAPFGIAVQVGPLAAARAAAVLASFSIEEGEKVFDTLERAARLQGVMLWTDGLGRLLIDLPGSRRAEVELVEGGNLLRAEARWRSNERFSEYIVKGQARGQPHGRGTARDGGVQRYRPLIILAEDQAQGPTAERRAAWEATVRMGRSRRCTVRVQGWRQHGMRGPLWQPGLRVVLDSPRLQLMAELLIVSVRYLKNAQDGTLCELELADPRAFDLLSGVRAAPLRKARRGDKGLLAGPRPAAARTGKREGGKEDSL